MKTEIEFLQGAFESYKTTLTIEMDEKWRKRASEMEAAYEEQLHSKLQEQSKSNRHSRGPQTYVLRLWLMEFMKTRIFIQSSFWIAPLCGCMNQLCEELDSPSKHWKAGG